MTAVVDREASQDIELEAARIDDYEDVDVSSMSDDSDDERSRSKTTKSLSARASSSVMPRRSFFSARFENISQVPRSSPLPPSPKSSQSPVEQAPRIEQAANSSRPEKSCPRSIDSSLWHAFSHDWIWEQIFLLIAIISLMAIILVLSLYNGHPVLDLPRVINANAILAIFSTSMTAALSVPLALSISQAKWKWFHDDQGGGKPFSDLEVYDQASRGPWGALVMLGKIRWRHFSSLGAVIIVLTLASDCTIQQTISYELRLAASPSRALSKPMLPISLGYNDTGSTELRKVMAKAIHYGLFGIPPASVSAAASCPSEECTWQPYDTLAVCSLCKNVTAKYPQGPGRRTKPCHEALTGQLVGPNICISPCLYTAPPTTRFFNAQIYFFELIRDQSDNTKLKQQTSKTYDCSLSWCIRSFSSAIATDGVLLENPRNSSNLTYIGEGRVRIVSEGISGSSSSSGQPPAGGNNPRNFTVDESSNNNLFNTVSYALNQLFYSAIIPQHPFDSTAIVDGNMNNHILLADPTPIFNNIANAISAQLRTIPFSSSSSSSSSNSLPNTTTTTTTTFVAPGTAFYREPVLVVLWAWLAFPVFLLFATAFFLFLVIFAASNPVWKDSLCPLVLLPRPRQGAIRIRQGQGQAQGQGLGYGLKDMKRMAGVRVRLQRDGTGGWGFTLGRQEGGV